MRYLLIFAVALSLAACSVSATEDASPVTFGEGNFYTVAGATGGGSYRIGTDALPEGLAAVTEDGFVDLTNYGTSLGYTQIKATVRGAEVTVRSIYGAGVCQVSYGSIDYQEPSDGNCDVTVYGPDWTAVFVSDGLNWSIAVK